MDLRYKIDGQSIIIFEIRPIWFKRDSGEKTKSAFAKATFIKSKNIWKVYWMRGNLKWESYEPKPEVKKINDFIKLVEEDKYNCFWG